MATAGKVDFPDYMKVVHEDWLHQTNDAIEASIVDTMNTALGGSPFSAMTAYDPATYLTAMDNAVAAFNTRVDALDPDGDWEGAVDTVVAKADAAVFDDTYVDADIAAFGDALDDQINNVVLPRFQGGMRDVNAVMSSAFVVGEAIIEGMRDRDVAKYGSEFRVKLNFQRNDFVLKGIERLLQDISTQVEMEKGVAHYTLEANRMRIVAQKEKKDTENSIAVNNGKWDLEVYQYGANLLAAIGGGTVVPTGSDSPSKTQSAIGGALAGASIGGNVGGGWGALIGGVLGGVGSLF